MIKAIQTEYNGYKFRSRLEARWAVFFDTLGIEYEYEPEGYELKNGMKYLPDFYLPDLNLWVEVKGFLTEYDEEKIRNFAIGKRVALLREIPNPKQDEIFNVISWSPYGENGKFLAGEMYSGEICKNGEPMYIWDAPYAFCVCPACGKIGYEFEGRGGRICGHEYLGDKEYSGAHPKLINAYKKARQARFEYGEKP